MTPCATPGCIGHGRPWCRACAAAIADRDRRRRKAPRPAAQMPRLTAPRGRGALRAELDGFLRDPSRLRDPVARRMARALLEQAQRLTR